jgi:DNA-binding CsgD family transcriptional regulator
MEPPSNSTGEEFIKAAQSWELERLYVDLAKAKKTVAPHKKKGLTQAEKERLRGLLCGYSPTEIAEKLYLSSGGIQVAISDLYRYVEALTKRSPHTIKNWRDIVEWLEAAGYKKSVYSNSSSPPSSSQQNWESAPDVSNFYGRTEELNLLREWILQDRCRIIAILGMGGIGKTTLSVKLAKELAEHFDYVIWHSLCYSPNLSKLIIKTLSFFNLPNSNFKFQSSTQLATDFDIAEGITKLIEYFQRYRCFLILDGLETLLQAGELAGRYLPEHQVYQSFIQRLGTENHNSCLCITSQEKTPELAALMGLSLPIRGFILKGLDSLNAQMILSDKGLSKQVNYSQLIELYRGNPLALKIVAATIQDVFRGSVDEFLQGSSLFVGDFGEILSQQFQRLSSLEKQILYALALERYPVTFFQLRDLLRNCSSTSKLTQAWESLGRRSLLENTAEGITLQPVVMKHVIAELVKQICNEVLLANRTQNIDRTSLLHHQLLLQFEQSGQNPDKLFNYRKILLKIETELRFFLKDTECERIEEKLSKLLVVIPKPSMLT